MNEWNIQARAHVCQSCNRTFADKQAYHTLLFDEKSQLTRLDVCEPCWQSQYSEGARDRKGFVSHWQGIYEAPPAAPPEAIKKENAESLLRKVIERNEPRYAAASYIMAVMLERKRLLKVKEQFIRDGQRIFIYEQPKTGDVFTIPDPNLQLNQLQDVQRDVADLLEHGLPDAESSTPTQAPAAETTPVATDDAESPPAFPGAAEAFTSSETPAAEPRQPSAPEPPDKTTAS